MRQRARGERLFPTRERFQAEDQRRADETPSGVAYTLPHDQHPIFVLLLLASVGISEIRAGGPEVPPIFLTDHLRHVDSLGLVGDQLPPATVAFQVFSADRQAAERANKTIARWIVSLAPSTYSAADEELSAQLSLEFERAEHRYDVEVRQLEVKYFTVLASINSGSRETIDALKRSRRRAILLRAEILPINCPAGTDLDLGEILAHLGIRLPKGSGIATLMLDYELQLDPMLLQLDSLLISHDEASRRSYEATRAVVGELGEYGAQNDIAEFGRVMARPYMVCSEIRGWHERVFESLISLLSSTDSDLLRREVEPRLYPFIYADAGPLTLLGRLEDLAELTDDQRGSLQAIRDAYVAERTLAVQRCAYLYRRSTRRAYYEALFEGVATAFATGDNSVREPLPEDVAFDEAIDKWKHRTRLSTARVLSVLTPEQRKHLE